MRLNTWQDVRNAIKKVVGETSNWPYDLYHYIGQDTAASAMRLTYKLEKKGKGVPTGITDPGSRAILFYWNEDSGDRLEALMEDGVCVRWTSWGSPKGPLDVEYWTEEWDSTETI